MLCMHGLQNEYFTPLCSQIKEPAGVTVVTTAVIAALNEQCSCKYPDMFISQEHFTCSSSSPNDVTYRAHMYLSVNHSASQLRELLNSWRTSEQKSIVFPASGAVLKVDRNCEIAISSFNDTLCHAGNRSLQWWENRIFLIAVPSAAAAVLVVMVTITTICCCIYCRYRKNKKAARWAHDSHMTLRSVMEN